MSYDMGMHMLLKRFQGVSPIHILLRCCQVAPSHWCHTGSHIHGRMRKLSDGLYERPQTCLCSVTSYGAHMRHGSSTEAAIAM